MAKREVQTDFWVHSLLQNAGINAVPQGSNIKEVNEALKSASKRGTGKVGYPEFIAVVKDFLIVIEDKADVNWHCKLDANGVVELDNTKAIESYAVNGALHYTKHLAKNTSFKKFIAIGVSGNEKRHKISPYFINDRGRIEPLRDLEDFIVLNDSNIDEYYTKEILKEQTGEEKTTQHILRDAEILHEDLRNYGNLRDTEKPLVVSGILLALEEYRSEKFQHRKP